MPAPVDEFTLLNDARFDYPERAGAPSLAYAVCSTPRSGSSLLCMRLWETGVAGAPWEYFNQRRIMPDLAKRLGTKTFADYVPALLRRRTSPNGVFGAKLHTDHAVNVVMTALKPARFIIVEREDKAAQAVSLVRALQSGRWSSMGRKEREATYSYPEIYAWHQWLIKAERRWRAALAGAQDRVHAVSYEALLQDSPATIAGCLRHLGVRANGKTVRLPALERLTEAEGDPWRPRYLEDFARLGAVPVPGKDPKKKRP